MHKAKAIQKVIHSLCMQLSKLEQVHDLNEIDHVQYDSVCLLCNKMSFQLCYDSEYQNEDGESETHVLQSF